MTASAARAFAESIGLNGDPALVESFVPPAGASASVRDRGALGARTSCPLWSQSPPGMPMKQGGLGTKVFPLRPSDCQTRDQSQPIGKIFAPKAGRKPARQARVAGEHTAPVEDFPRTERGRDGRRSHRHGGACSGGCSRGWPARHTPPRPTIGRWQRGQSDPLGRPAGPCVCLHPRRQRRW